MKRKLISILFAVFIITIYSCSEDDDIPVLGTKSESITMGVGYANDIYYNLSTGVVSEVARATWDIAFSVNAQSSSILINEGSGVMLKAYPNAWQWVEAIDTTGFSTWSALYNDDVDWEEGAFGQNATGHPNYGWGEYDMSTHNLTGVALYVIKLRDKSFRQIFIEKKESAAKKFTFKFANLDGTNAQTVIVDASTSNANFVYYNLETNAKVDREPEASTWDLVFTKWVDNAIKQTVTGVLQNKEIAAIDRDDVVDLTSIVYAMDEFKTDITEIGYDWKDFDMGTFTYSVQSDRMFFAKDKNEKIYKIIFTGFEGSSTGNLTFDITKL